MQKKVKKRPVIENDGYGLSKKVMKKLIEKEDIVKAVRSSRDER